jgi:hypothetical protein
MVSDYGQDGPGFIPVGPGFKIVEFVDTHNPYLRVSDMVGWLNLSSEGSHFVPCYFHGERLTPCFVPKEGDECDPYHIAVVSDLSSLDSDSQEFPIRDF